MVYNYTKPRKPVMSSYSGPGPCYGLPGLTGEEVHDPRSVHSKAPGYSFGLKHGKFSDNCSPGPCYGNMNKVYRSGREEAPRYTMVWRPKSAPVYMSPGPAAYSPERSGQQSYLRSPAFVFGSRNPMRKSDKTPGPNTYNTHDKITVPSGKRNAPAYSMCGKRYIGSFYEDRAKTPGPSAYGSVRVDTYKSRSPGYFMTGKNIIPGDNTTKPGPGAHSPENTIPKKAAPKFTFGLKHSPYEAPLILDPVDS